MAPSVANKACLHLLTPGWASKEDCTGSAGLDPDPAPASNGKCAPGHGGGRRTVWSQGGGIFGQGGWKREKIGPRRGQDQRSRLPPYPNLLPSQAGITLDFLHQLNRWYRSK